MPYKKRGPKGGRCGEGRCGCNKENGSRNYTKHWDPEGDGTATTERAEAEAFQNTGSQMRGWNGDSGNSGISGEEKMRRDGGMKRTVEI